MLRRILGRLRGNELTPLERHIAADKLPIPDAEKPARRGRITAAALRHKTTVITVSAIVGGLSLYGGGVFVGMWYEDMSQEAQREHKLRLEWERNIAKQTALTGAYKTAYQEELEEHSVDRPNINPDSKAGREKHFAWLREHPPEDSTTLAIREELEEVEAEIDSISRQLFED